MIKNIFFMIFGLILKDSILNLQEKKASYYKSVFL